MLTDPALCRTYRLTTPADVTAPKAARDVVAALLGLHHLDSLTDAARLLTSEVVTNAVQHTPTPVLTVETVITRAGVTVTVNDGVPGHGDLPMAQAFPSPTETSGRGLCLVEALAHRWGVSRYGGVQPVGKGVWFELWAAWC